jgi:hypothetical protein
MADPTSVWNEVAKFLGLMQKPKAPKRLEKPRPLTPMSQDEVDQFTAEAHNLEVARMLSRPGAMILDTPLSRGRSDAEMMAEFERTGVTQRPALKIQESDLPKGTLTSRAIGTKRKVR